MEITQLKYFLEVAESQHITMSAEKLHIAQPALSQAIRRLEKELGVPLFEKKGRNIILTKYGKYVQRHVLPIMRELDSLPTDLQAMFHVEQKTVYINVLAASTFIINAIIRYQETHRNVKFQLLQNSAAENFDIQITTKLFYQKSEEYADLQYVYNEKIYLAVPNHERYKDLHSITLKEVEGENFISLVGSRQFRYICDKLCHYAGVQLNTTFESDSPAAVQNMIASNMGVGFWPEHSWGKINNKKIKLLPISDPPCSRDIILSLNRNTESKYAEDFFRFLCSLL